MVKNLSKILKTIKKNDVVEIQWVDHASEVGWSSDIKCNTPFICNSVGYYEGHDKIYVMVCGSRDPNGLPGNISYRLKKGILKIRKWKI